ncbi:MULTISPECIES: elongation factor G [unclassified Ruegeria]|uniref:elongation factor G n=1 Tax=unclassified Ruegeria TaxID=2625375 RepID=UPI00148843FB|nr:MULTISPECIES: elongation factor G [unclassified Ruegeria]NOD78400.1 elongation factor G [Ruegeria sp. HKCCD4332]NOD90460.1 elongation factor G [Ruegeria sp. HKCCD4318]NOE15532.1 elongation factor G [Ruegeria sp. HKCCD4318-2]NOG10254.1 elongation factor G [Ruegeria sp. HKCCD4315]
MRVFTVLGPSQSGKSTLVEAISRLDGRPTTFDVSGTVHLHGFSYLDEPWCAIDVDGGGDALAYVGPAMAISDAAVVVVPPDPNAAVLCAPYLRLVEEAGIPCFLFINRMDNPNGRIRDIIAALQTYCTHHIALRQVPIREGDTIIGAVDLISERAWKYQEGQPSALIELPQSVEDREQEARTELLETLSDFDDHLLEQLIEDKQPPNDEVYDLAAQVLQNHQLIPACLGAASHGNGLTRLMKALRHEAPEFDIAAGRDEAADSARAIAGFADVKKHIGKIVVLRGLGDGVQAHEALGGETVGNLTTLDAKTQIATLEAGQIGLAVKSDHLNPGYIYDSSSATELPEWASSHPVAHRQIVSPAHERDDVRLSNALSRLAEIDPGLHLQQDELSGHSILGSQGPQHMRRVTAKLAEDFGIEIEADQVETAYRETIRAPVEHRHRHRKQSGGAGQFADVVISVAPLPRGSGFQFEEVVKGGAVPKNYIPSVEHGAKDALEQGPEGFPVVDVKVTLSDGKHHNVDSSDYAFRTAGKNAVREALPQAKPVVLQPILTAEIHLPSDFVGDLVPTISSLQGQVLGFEGNPNASGWEIFNAQIPAVTEDELHRTLASATRGTGWVKLTFDHYEELRGPVPKAATKEKASA